MSIIFYYLVYALCLAIAATYDVEKNIYCNDCSAENKNCKISEFGRSCRGLPPDYNSSSADGLGAYNPLEHGHSSSNLDDCIPFGMNTSLQRITISVALGPRSLAVSRSSSRHITSLCSAIGVCPSRSLLERRNIIAVPATNALESCATVPVSLP
ncbi:uncharacterized protein LOC111075014 isoform X3 [Drosophila obscura]|uniref:uncharacterized protein LOC111075014 isoform X3 n=1 Tax=Drosophila obscura TaxID=7282 RepID=UPI001BB2CEF2|nr:uncharacterized protein LOC111075014 isoform X3 [Drosophila obscura]